MAPERIVTLLSPIFVALSGAIVAWAAKNFPGGPQLDPTMLAGVFAIGAAAAIAAVLKWVHGRSAFTLAEAKAKHDLELAQTYAASTPAVGAALADVEKVLSAHSDQIVTKVGALVHAPPSAVDIAEQILAKIEASGTTLAVVGGPRHPAPVPVVPVEPAA